MKIKYRIAILTAFLLFLFFPLFAYPQVYNARAEVAAFSIRLNTNIAGDRQRATDAATAFRDAWDQFVQERGNTGDLAIFRTPPGASRRNRINVYLRSDMRQGELGTTYWEKDANNNRFCTIWLNRNQGAASLKLTCYHEFFHCIQGAYVQDKVPWLCEGTAVWAESVSPVDQTHWKDFANEAIAFSGQDPIDHFGARNRYTAVLFFKFLDENANRYNNSYTRPGQIIRAIFENYRNSPQSIHAVAAALGDTSPVTGENFRRALLEYAAALYLKTGAKYAPYVLPSGSDFRNTVRDAGTYFPRETNPYYIDYDPATGEIGPGPFMIMRPLLLRHRVIKPFSWMKEPTSLRFMVSLPDDRPDYFPEYCYAVLEMNHDGTVKLVRPDVKTEPSNYISYSTLDYGPGGRIKEAVFIGVRLPRTGRSLYQPLRQGQTYQQREAAISANLAMTAVPLKGSMVDPPYLKHVTVTQGNTNVYVAEWLQDAKVNTDDTEDITRRRMTPESGGLLKIGQGSGTADIKLGFSTPIPDAPTVELGGTACGTLSSSADKKTWTFRVNCEDLSEETELRLSVRALSRGGNRLDAVPATPCRLGIKDDHWLNYEGDDRNPIGGADEQHIIPTQTPPPIVQRVEIYGEGKRFVVKHWQGAPGAATRDLVTEPMETEPEGVNIGEVSGVSIQISFSQPINKDTVKVMFGDIEVPMTEITSDMYEGTLPITQFIRTEMDRRIQITIEGKNRQGTALDADPATVARLDPAGQQWQQDEAGPDRNFKLRLFGRAKFPIITGYVYWIKPDHPVDNPFQIRNHKSGVLGYPFPVGETPMAGFNVYYGVAYAQITDKALAAEFEKLTATSVAVKKRNEKGLYKVSLAEYRELWELQNLKPKVQANVSYFSGSQPGWHTVSNARGEFSFPLTINPPENGVVYLVLQTCVFPPFGKPTSFYRPAPQQLDLVYFAPGFTDFFKRFMMRWHSKVDHVTPFYAQRKNLKANLNAAKDEAAKAKKELDKAKKEWSKRPAHIEKSWKDRALKYQRQLEKKYEQQFGVWQDWKDDTRKRFERELAEQPVLARRSWEKDVKDHEEKKKEALDKLEKVLLAKREKVKEIETMMVNFKEAKNKMLERQARDGIDIAIWVSNEHIKDDQWGKIWHKFEQGGNFSGRQITPPLRDNRDTIVALIKQTIDEDCTLSEYDGINTVTGEKIVHWYKNNPQSPRPPFAFTFNKPLKDHLVIYDYAGNYGWRGPLDHVGAGPVYTVFHSGLAFLNWQGIDCLNNVFASLSPHVRSEVEGYPVKNRKRFNQLCDEDDKLEEALDKLDRDYRQIYDDVRAGRLTYKDASNKFLAMSAEYGKLVTRILAVREEIKKINPAFNPKVINKILGGKAKPPAPPAKPKPAPQNRERLRELYVELNRQMEIKRVKQAEFDRMTSGTRDVSVEELDRVTREISEVDLRIREINAEIRQLEGR